jgi:transcriptional regulator with XRE-family HTH domain
MWGMAGCHTFAEQLRELREARGWSLRQLSKRVHISKASLSRYESGLQVPQAASLVRLARVFRVRAEVLLG